MIRLNHDGENWPIDGLWGSQLSVPFTEQVEQLADMGSAFPVH
jgi:hypothetical protein